MSVMIESSFYGHCKMFDYLRNKKSPSPFSGSGILVKTSIDAEPSLHSTHMS